MMIIVPVEEAALLVAVDRVVGGVEVEDQRLGRLGMGGEELIDEHGGDADQRRCDRRGSPGGRGSPGEASGVAASGSTAGGQLQGRVVAEGGDGR